MQKKIQELKKKFPARIVHFWSLIDYSKRPDGDPDRVSGVREVARDCRLSGGVYKVMLRPGIPNPNLQGLCGAAVTGEIRILKDGTEVLEKTAFENLDCNARDSYVSEISVGGKRGKVQIRRVP